MDAKNERKSYIASQFRVSSISYGLFVCLIGVVLNSIEPFKACKSPGNNVNNPIKITIEGFYIYMHITSIICIITIVALIVTSKKNQKVSVKQSDGKNKRLAFENNESVLKKINSSKAVANLKRKLSNVDTYKSPTTTSNKLAAAAQTSSHVKFTSNNSSDIAECVIFNTGREVSDSEAEVGDDYHYTYDYNNGTGELYMRCGIAIFSVCALIDRCLNLVQMAEVYLNEYEALEGNGVAFTFTLVSVFTSIVFIFVQSFFIFKYANIIINHGKNLSVIGIMHVISTNFCITMRTIIKETVSEIEQYSHEIHTTNKVAGGHSRDIGIGIEEASHIIHRRALVAQNASSKFNTPNEKVGCIDFKNLDSEVILYVRDTQDKLDSYLFPCIIEYSLMCVTVFFILWDGIESKYLEYAFNHKQLLRIQGKKKHAEIRDANHFTVDCGKSTTGLFFGILVLLLTIISLIIYFIYHEHNQIMAIKLSEMMECILLSISLIVTIAIFIQLKIHNFKARFEPNLDYNSVLTVIGLAGVYLYGFYSIIAILNDPHEEEIHKLFLTVHILSLVEATLQTGLIVNGLKMYTVKESNKVNKPGRSLIIILILIDVSLWIVETLCIKKYDMNLMQLDYYDIIFWSIVSSISSPLAIFFRFHASVCLSDIWKTLYE